MKRFRIGLGIALTCAILFSLLASASLASSPPKLTLTPASKTGKLGTSLRVYVSVVSSQPAYEIWIYGRTTSSWHRVASATLVSSGKYTAFVKLTKKGKLLLRAAFIDKSGTVRAYSNTVSITVT